MRVLLLSLATAAAGVAVAGAAPVASPPSAEPLLRFTGLSSSQAPGVNPADVQIAVGPTAAVQTVNTSIGIWSRTGRPLRGQPLGAFFSGGGVDRSRDSMTDPRVLWDPLAGRWFAVVFDITRLELDVAVSSGEDPLAPWTVFPLPSTGCPDQPRLGTSSTLVVVADDLFSSCRGFGRFLGGEVTVLSKQDLIDGAASPRRSHFGPDARFGAITPAVSLSAAPTMYMTSVATSGKTIELFSLDDSTVSSLPFQDVPLATPLRDADEVVQRGSQRTLDAGDDRVQNAVFDAGELWLTASETCGGGRTCARVIGIDPTRARLLRETTVALPGGRSLVYPAVVPDTRGNLVLGYSYASAADFPGFGATYLRPDGQVAQPLDLISGSAPNESGRFGDYSGAARDPADSSVVWVSAEIGQATDGTTAGWTSGIASVRVPPQPPAVAVTRVAADGSGATVTAQVYTEGADAAYRVDYGLTTGYGTRADGGSVEAAVRSETVTVAVPALTPGRTYHLRVVATGANGSSPGPDVVLKTPAGPPRVAYPLPAALRNGDRVTLRARVDAAGAPTSVVFRFGPTGAYGRSTGTLRVPGSAVAAVVSATVRAKAGRPLYFRVVARNAKGTVTGSRRAA